MPTGHTNQPVIPPSRLSLQSSHSTNTKRFNYGQGNALDARRLLISSLHIRKHGALRRALALRRQLSQQTQSAKAQASFRVVNGVQSYAAMYCPRVSCWQRAVTEALKKREARASGCGRRYMCLCADTCEPTNSFSSVRSCWVCDAWDTEWLDGGGRRWEA